MPRVPKIEAPTAPKQEIPQLFNWRNLIPLEYLKIKDSWLIANGVENYNELTAEQKEELRDRAGDENMSILLGGFKHIAHLRGIKGTSYQVTSNETGTHITCVGRVDFQETKILGYIFPEASFSGVANASTENTTFPFGKFMESIAENRAFCRAIRMACNINAVGEDEMETRPSEGKDIFADDTGIRTAQGSLERLMIEKSKTFSDMKRWLETQSTKTNEDGKRLAPYNENWNDYKDIESNDCLSIITLVLSKKSKSEN